MESARGVDGGYQLAAGSSLPPLALDDDEAVALAVGLQAATASTVASMAEPSLRALTKVVQVMPPRLRRQVDALQAMTVTGSWADGCWGAASWAAGTTGPDPAVLLAAAQACRGGEEVALEYTAADGGRTRRGVEPHRLVCMGRRWYLVAFDLDRQAWRTFRVDRVMSMTPDGRHFRQRELPAADAATFVQQSIRAAPMNYDVRAVLHCQLPYAQTLIGRWADLRELPGERCLMSMRTESLEWAALALGTVGAEATDVEPAALVTLLHDWSQRFGRACR